MKFAKIYSPAKRATQSGKARDGWVLDVQDCEKRQKDSLMGWVGGDAKKVTIKFSSKESAVAYAKKHNIEFCFALPKMSTTKPKSYAENFTHNFTHKV